MRHVRVALAVLLLAFFGPASEPAQPPAQPAQLPGAAAKAGELDAEDLKDLAIAERFQRVLEGNPRRGTAFDRLYGYYVERGLLDRLVANYTTRTKTDAKDGVAWIIIGILEGQRGRDAAAVDAFRRAETSRLQIRRDRSDRS